MPFCVNRNGIRSATKTSRPFITSRRSRATPSCEQFLTPSILKHCGLHLRICFGNCNEGKPWNRLWSVVLMMLAFLIDQTQQLCPLFRAASGNTTSKRMLWKRIRSFIFEHIVSSMWEVLVALAGGYSRSKVGRLNDTS